MSMRGKILVIRGGAIGDFILTLPVLTALRQNFPNAEIHVLGYPKVAQLAVAGRLADGVRSIEAQALASFFANRGELPVELAEYFASFNIIISFLYDPDEFFQTNVRRSFTGQFIQGPHRPNELDNQHATDVFLKPLERLAIYGADPIPRLNIGAFNPFPDLIAIHPGSGSEKKNWPEPKWHELLDRISAGTKFKILIVGGEAEGGRLQRLQARMSPERVELAQNLPLTELAQRLTSCSLFMGHDSGITHLASALDVPGLVLWGPSNATIWQPRNSKMSLIGVGNELSGLAVEELFERVSSAIS